VSKAVSILDRWLLGVCGKFIDGVKGAAASIGVSSGLSTAANRIMLAAEEKADTSQTDELDRYAASDEDYAVLSKAISLVDGRVKTDQGNWTQGLIIEGEFGGDLSFDDCQECVNPLIPEGVRVDGMGLAVGYDYGPIRNVPAIVISGPSYPGGTRRGWIEHQQEFIVKNTGMGRWTELSVRTGAVVIVHSPYDGATLVYQGTRDVQEFRRK